MAGILGMQDLAGLNLDDQERFGRCTRRGKRGEGQRQGRA